MTTILKINSSIYSENGQSSQLAGQFIDSLREREPGLRVIERDLARDPLPHLDAARFQAFLTKPEERTPEQQAVAEFSDALIREVRRRVREQTGVVLEPELRLVGFVPGSPFERPSLEG